MTATIEQILRNANRELLPHPTGAAPKLQRLEGISAVLFDVYGTLLISASGDIGKDCEDRQPEAFRGTMAAAGLDYRGTEAEGVDLFVDCIKQRHRQLRAEGTECPEVDVVEIWRTILDRLQRGKLLDGQTYPAEIARQLAVEYEVRSNPVWPMPHCAETLQELVRRGTLLGIISNAQFYTPLLFPALLGKDLDQLGFDESLRFYSYQYLQAKPGMDLYDRADRALQRMNVSPGQVLYVGNDMLKDIWPARKIGFRTALFAGDARSLKWREDDPRVADAAPDLVVTDLSQLLDCLVEK